MLELICDGGDHINQLRYDVDNGRLGGHFIELADMLDEVLDAIHRAANELTDNAFELEDDIQYSQKIGGELYDTKGMGRINESAVYVRKNAEQRSSGGGEGTPFRRGAVENSGGSSLGKIRPENLTKYERERLSEILLTPILNDEHYNRAASAMRLDNILDTICTYIADGNETVVVMQKHIKGFSAAVDEAIRFVNREKREAQRTLRDAKLPLPVADNHGHKLTNGQSEYFKSSRIRDNDGNLLVLFHGSSSEAFTEFEMYNGIWATTDRDYASSYTGGNSGTKIYRLYADGRNGLELGDINDITLNDGAIKELADMLDEVLDAIHRAANELTDNAFELEDDTPTVDNKKTASEGGTRFSRRLSNSDLNDYLIQAPERTQRRAKLLILAKTLY